MDRTGSISLPRHYWWTAIAAAAFAATTLASIPLAGITLDDILFNDRGGATLPTLFVGVGLTGGFFWWLLLAWQRRYTFPRGAMAGVFTAFFSYPVVLILSDIVRHPGMPDLGGFGARGSNIFLRSILAQLSTGFATTVLLALVGILAVWLLRRRHPEAAPARNPAGFWRSAAKAAGGLALIIVLGLIVSFAVLTAMPLGTAELATPSSSPAASYDEATALIDMARAEELKLPLNSRCLSTLLTHGRKVERVVVFFHGLSNCPAQAEQLAAKLFALGYNVYLPRVPQHGDADQMSLALAELTAEDMAAVGNQATDIAQGLGDEVVVAGLSAGGIITAWIAQNRADADQAIVIAPFLRPNVVPDWADRAVTNLLLNIPNTMVWWDSELRDNPPGMTYAYPRFATRGLAQALRLSTAVMEQAHDAAPLSPRIVMLLNEADTAVSFAKAEGLMRAWQRNGAAVKPVTLPLALGIGHDLIDPHQPTGNPDLVYGLLIDTMNGAGATTPQ